MQRKRVLWSSWILNECKFSCKIVKNCRIIGLNRAKKNKIMSEVCMIKKDHMLLRLPETWWEKSTFKRLVYMPPDSSPRFTSKVNLSNTKTPAWFFILASLLDKGIQHVNWLPPRTTVARVFLKIIFRGHPITHGLSNGAKANANTIHE